MERGRAVMASLDSGTGKDRCGLSFWNRAGQRWPLCMERGRADVASLDSGTVNNRGVLYVWKRA